MLLLSLDLFFHRNAKEISIKEALATSGLWVGVALLFNIGVYFVKGPEDALNFLTGYLIEYFLSIDNLFVFLLIFSYFQVPQHYLHKVLFWGILGAIIMRAAFILCGIALVKHFPWTFYILGAFLIFTGIKLALEKRKKFDIEKNIILRIFRKYFPITDHYQKDRFFIRQGKKILATPLFIALLAIETVDLMFAIDSIPAIMGITLDPFIIYTSNIFAILGLRSLYFVLIHVMKAFYFLHEGISIILIFIGLKMLLSELLPISLIASFAFILFVLATSLILSIYVKKTPS